MQSVRTNVSIRLYFDRGHGGDRNHWNHGNLDRTSHYEQTRRGESDRRQTRHQHDCPGTQTLPTRCWQISWDRTRPSVLDD